MKIGVSQQFKFRLMVSPYLPGLLAMLTLLAAGLDGISWLLWCDRRGYMNESAYQVGVQALEVGLLGWDGGVQHRLAAEGGGVRISPYPGWMVYALLSIVAPLVGLKVFRDVSRWRYWLACLSLWAWLSIWLIAVATWTLEGLGVWSELMCRYSGVIHLGLALSLWNAGRACALVLSATLLAAVWTWRWLRRGGVSAARCLLLLPWLWALHSLVWLKALAVRMEDSGELQSGWHTLHLCAALLTPWLVLVTVGLVLMVPARFRDVIKLARIGLRCQHCGYDLRGTLEAGRVECPECGGAVPVSLQGILKKRVQVDGGARTKG